MAHGQGGPCSAHASQEGGDSLRIKDMNIMASQIVEY
jgi:hypothetical protein